MLKFLKGKKKLGALITGLIVLVFQNYFPEHLAMGDEIAKFLGAYIVGQGVGDAGLEMRRKAEADMAKVRALDNIRKGNDNG